MMFEPLHPLEDSKLHACWLHELRSVVSTASVAAAMARRLVDSDAGTAAEMLQEAERALLACRDLLASGGDHVMPDALPQDTLRTPSMPAARRDGDRVTR